MNAITLNGVSKRFPTFELGPLDLEVKQGELLGIFGPPSSGKTSILKVILGLLRQDDGDVSIRGMSGADLNISERGISMVFQNLALFPHMTGEDNIVFPLKESGADRQFMQSKLEDVSKALHIEHILHKKPGQMSGGERQRIALGRALAAESRAILLDEPISALDARLREEMRLELKRLQREQNQTFVYVSHDEEEVMSIADRVVILVDGKIAQVGDPDEIYHAPVNTEVAALVGSPPMNLFRGKVAADGVHFECDDFDTSVPIHRSLPPGEYTLGVRPEDIYAAAPGEAHSQTLSIASVEPLGSHSVLNAQIGSQLVKIRASGHVKDAKDFGTSVAFALGQLHFFDETGKRV